MSTHLAVVLSGHGANVLGRWRQNASGERRPPGAKSNSEYPEYPDPWTSSWISAADG